MQKLTAVLTAASLGFICAAKCHSADVKEDAQAQSIANNIIKDTIPKEEGDDAQARALVNDLLKKSNAGSEDVSEAEKTDIKTAVDSIPKTSPVKAKPKLSAKKVKPKPQPVKKEETGDDVILPDPSEDETEPQADENKPAAKKPLKKSKEKPSDYFFRMTDDEGVYRYDASRRPIGDAGNPRSKVRAKEEIPEEPFDMDFAEEEPVKEEKALAILSEPKQELPVEDEQALQDEDVPVRDIELVETEKPVPAKPVKAAASKKAKEVKLAAKPKPRPVKEIQRPAPPDENLDADIEVSPAQDNISKEAKALEKELFSTPKKPAPKPGKAKSDMIPEETPTANK
ncbi:MAG: hypothetical protein NTW04_04545 [Elusimicrobia bacterium]|nr:hypothetical protein [Elusimicrobiota bacterium]